MAASASIGRWRDAELITRGQATAITRVLRGGEPEPEAIEEWVERGLITPNQAAEIRGFEKASNGNGAKTTTEILSSSPPPAPAEQAVAQPLPAAVTFALPRHLPRPSWLIVPARRLGLLLAFLALLSLVVVTISLVTDLFIAPWRLGGPDLEDMARLVAGLLGFMGGLRLYRGGLDGKAPVLSSLIINALASLVFKIGSLFDPIVLAPLAGWVLLFYLTAISETTARATQMRRPA
jgi:hypothetical protein